MSGEVSTGKDLNREVKIPQPAETTVARPSRAAAEAAEIKGVGLTKEETDAKIGPVMKSVEEILFNTNDLTLLTQAQQARITSLDGLPE